MSQGALRQNLTLDSAIELAKNEGQLGIDRLRKASNIYTQILNQVRPNAEVLADAWRTQRLLNPDWDYCSQHGQDKFIYENFFQNSGAGTFVDVGAFDGISGSNTAFFERRGWDGLCIEASPTHFEQLVRNRRTTSVNLAIAEHASNEEFLEIRRGYTQMGGLVRDIRDEALATSSPSHSGARIHVPIRPLCEVLDEAGIEKVDYCSIDVEGAELRVLQGIDFERVAISVLSIEVTNAENLRLFSNLLEPNGFQHLETIGYDAIFASRSAKISHYRNNTESSTPLPG